MERWVQEYAAQMGRIFGLSDLQMVPFYLKIGLDILRVLAKCLIFDEFFFWLTYRLSKSIPIHMVKSTDLFKKKALQETYDSDIGCKFSSSLVRL